MTNLQLLLSIGIPSLLIALTFLATQVRFIGMEKRMDGLDSDLRAFRAETRQEFVAIRAEHRQDLVAIHADLKQFYGMTTKLEGRMDEISKR